MAKSFKDTIANYKIITNDSSTDNDTFGKLQANICIRQVLSLQDWTFNKASMTISSISNQQNYPSPYNCLKMDYVNVYTGGLWYTPAEMMSGKMWTNLNYTTTYSDIPQWWYVSNRTKKIGIFPIPSSNGNTIKMGYTKKIIDLTDTEYSTGSITTISGQTTIIGSGTNWDYTYIGKSIFTNGFWYEITNVNSPTNLTIKEAAQLTLTGQTYIIADIIPFPDGYEDIPLSYCSWKYYEMRENTNMALQYKNMYDRLIDEMKRRDARSVEGIIERQKVEIIDPNSNPYAIHIYP